jgi:hypothetical protein
MHELEYSLRLSRLLQAINAQPFLPSWPEIRSITLSSSVCASPHRRSG